MSISISPAVLMTLALLAPAHAQGRLDPHVRADHDLGLLSLGVATGTEIFTGNGFYAFRIGEQQNGLDDLNGDGDFTDAVLHVFDIATRTLKPVGLATGVFQSVTVGDRLVFAVDERGQGSTDLNGDGDAIDRVAHLYDHRTGKTRNLGLAVLSPSDILHAEDLALILVREHPSFGSGQNVDLNGDGDTFDRIAHVHRLADGSTVNLGLPVLANPTVRWVAPGRVALPVSELDQGSTDLNGDGDAFDDVLHTYTLEGGAVWNTGVAGDPLGFASRSLVGFAGEAAQGADLNGDGDQLDFVLHRFELRTHFVSNEGLAALNPQLAPHPVSGHRAAVMADEAANGSTDLNGDGDASDYVLHVYDAATRHLTNLELAVVAGGTPQAFPAFDHGLLGFWVEESSQGGTDLNGNGSAVDTVLHVFDADPGLVANLALASQFAACRVDRGLVTFLVSEPSQGLDLNGDGDAGDPWVPHVYDRRSRSTTGLGLAGHRDRFGTGRGSVSMLVDEASQGLGDLNGDGDAQDVVHHFYDARSGALRNLGLACATTVGTPAFLGPGPALVFVAESGEGRDLNGDGDLIDLVPFFVGL